MTDLKQVTPLNAPSTDDGVVAWLDNLSKDHPFLLAFAHDGVIWGKPENGKWSTSFDAFGKPFAQLRGQTLLEAFAFGDKDQVHLYRDGEKWAARQVFDAGEWFDELQLLWGNKWEAQSKGFTRLADRVQETLEHALPLDIDQTENLDLKAPRLTVRHYITTDEHEFDDRASGEARIHLSRLVSIEFRQKDA